MDPDLWDTYAAKFGQETAVQKLGPRPGAVSAPQAEQPTQLSVPGLPSSREDAEGYVRAMGQGFFGLGDELRSGVAALGAMVPGGRSPGEAFRETMASEKAAQDEWAAENPWRNMAAQVVGGGAGVAGASRLLQGLRAAGAAGAVQAGTGGAVGRTAASAPLRLLKGAASAGAAGAVASAGLAEGGPRERMEAMPAGFGWGVGGAAAVGALRPVGRLTADALDVRTPEGVRERARQIFLEYMRKGETTVDDMARNAGRLRGPIAGAEAAGPQVQKLVGVVESKPGPAATRLRDALTERQGRSPQRIDDAVRQASGVRAGDLEGELERMTAAQRSRARPLYDQAYAVGQVDDPELAEMLDLPEFRTAYDRARRIVKIRDNVDLPGLDEGPPTLEALDRMKRALDKGISGGMGSDASTDRDMAFALRDRLGAVLDRLDTRYPVYGQARAAWRGDEAAKEAFEEGYKKFRSIEPEALERRLRGPNADAYRLGIARFLREEAGGVTERSGSQNLAGRLMGSGDRQLWAPGSEAKIRIAFGNKGPNEFLGAMESEGTMHSTFRQMSGSRTAPLLEGGEELERGLGAAAQTARAAQGDVGALASLMATVRRSRAAGFNQRTMAELADMMTAGINDPTDLQKLIEELRRAETMRSGTTRAVGAGLAGGLVGGR